MHAHQPVVESLDWAMTELMVVKEKTSSNGSAGTLLVIDVLIFGGARDINSWTGTGSVGG